MIGIYKITNKINGKFYIGQSISIENRFQDHKAPRSSKRNYPICRAIKKYGKENFAFEVIEICQQDELNQKEIEYIKTLCPHYNISEGGSGNKGNKPSIELRNRLSKKNKEYWDNLSEEKKKSIVANFKRPDKGHVVTTATRKKLSNIFTGHKFNTPESNSKRSEFMKEYSKTHDMARRKKSVLQLTIDSNELVNEFETIKQAAESIGVHPTCILGVISGKRKSSRGYKWVYKNRVAKV